MVGREPGSSDAVRGCGLIGTTHPTDARAFRPVLAIAALAIVARAIPAFLAYGTSDVMAWELLGQLLLNGENFYATQLHNWPPLWIYLTAGAWLVHQATGLPFHALVKIPPILADGAVAALLCWMARGDDERARLTSGLGYALIPWQS
jgi:hypothetical protein